MAYIPGFTHDIFISYAHGDDRAWIGAFVARLNTELDRRLGIKTAIWIDADDNRATRDFSKEIPDSVRASAVFLMLASPTYIRSAYVDEECRIFWNPVCSESSVSVTPVTSSAPAAPAPRPVPPR